MDRRDYKELITAYLDEINARPCPHCGKRHSVGLTYVDADVHIVSPQFSEDCCDAFRDEVGRVLVFIVKVYNAPLKYLGNFKG